MTHRRGACVCVCVCSFSALHFRAFCVSVCTQEGLCVRVCNRFISLTSHLGKSLGWRKTYSSKKGNDHSLLPDVSSIRAEVKDCSEIRRFSVQAPPPPPPPTHHIKSICFVSVPWARLWFSAGSVLRQSPSRQGLSLSSHLGNAPRQLVNMARLFKNEWVKSHNSKFSGHRILKLNV